MTDPYVCAQCGHQWPVVSLARNCERKHDQEETSE